MGKFLLGVIVTVLVLILGGLGIAMLGFIPTTANVPPSHLEQHLANNRWKKSSRQARPRLVGALANPRGEQI